MCIRDSYNRIHRAPLMQCVEQTRAVARLISEQHYAKAMDMRGGSFTAMFDIFKAMAEALPSVAPPARPRRIAVIHGGALAPGMNTATRAAIRLGLDRGHAMLGVRGSFAGLIDGRIEELSWGDVEGWTALGGAELGASRQIPTTEQLYPCLLYTSRCV